MGAAAPLVSAAQETAKLEPSAAVETVRLRCLRGLRDLRLWEGFVGHAGLTAHGRRMANDEWLSTEQVAEHLGVTSQWVRKQITAGRLRGRAYLTGSRSTYRIRRTDLSDFILTWSRDTDQRGVDER